MTMPPSKFNAKNSFREAILALSRGISMRSRGELEAFEHKHMRQTKVSKKKRGRG